MHASCSLLVLMLWSYVALAARILLCVAVKGRPFFCGRWFAWIPTQCHALQVSPRQRATRW